MEMKDWRLSRDVHVVQRLHLVQRKYKIMDQVNLHPSTGMSKHVYSHQPDLMKPRPSIISLACNLYIASIKSAFWMEQWYPL